MVKVRKQAGNLAGAIKQMMSNPLLANWEKDWVNEGIQEEAMGKEND